MKVPSIYYLIRQLLILELVVQIIEGSFYFWLAYNFNKVLNVTPKRYLDWVITTPTMLVTLMLYLIFLNKKEENATDNLDFFTLCKENSNIFIPVLVLNWLMKSGKRAELGAHFMGVGLGIVVSALAAAWFQSQDLTWSNRWLGFGLIALLCALAAWRWRPPVPDTVSTQSHQSSAPRPWLWLMLSAYFCAGVGFVVSATFTVAIIEAVPTLAGLGAWAWFICGIAATPSVYLWDRVARRFGELPALMVAYTCQVSSVVLPAVSDHWLPALMAAALFGGTAIGIVSMTLAFVGKRSPNNPGKAMAQLTLGYGAAQIAGPALTAYAVDATGSYHGALWMTAAILMMGVWFLNRLRQTQTSLHNPS